MALRNQMHPENQKLLDRSLDDACKIARRLSRHTSSEAHDAALKFIRELRGLGAKDKDD